MEWHVDEFISDHRFVQLQMEHKQTGTVLKKTNVRNLKQVSNSNLQEKFCELKVSNETDINSVCKLFENDFKKIIDELAPITEKIVRDRTPKPWFNTDM